MRRTSASQLRRMGLRVIDESIYVGLNKEKIPAQREKIHTMILYLRDLGYINKKQEAQLFYELRQASENIEKVFEREGDPFLPEDW